jgi:hypothetical protein
VFVPCRALSARISTGLKLRQRAGMRSSHLMPYAGAAVVRLVFAGAVSAVYGGVVLKFVFSIRPDSASSRVPLPFRDILPRVQNAR